MRAQWERGLIPNETSSIPPVTRVAVGSFALLRYVAQIIQYECVFEGEPGWSAGIVTKGKFKAFRQAAGVAYLAHTGSVCFYRRMTDMIYTVADMEALGIYMLMAGSRVEKEAGLPPENIIQAPVRENVRDVEVS